MTQPPQYPSYPGDQPQQPPVAPPGYQPPPAPGYPPAGQYPPPGYQPPGYQGPPLAGWWSRVGAYLIDSLIVLAIVVVPVIVGAVVAFADAETDLAGNVTGGVNPLGIVLMVLGGVLGFAFHAYNRGVRIGRTGQSFGKQLLGNKVLGLETGRPIGAGMGLLRLLLDYIFGNACFINYLWPLWDDKKQTWHDMVVKTVVVRV